MHLGSTSIKAACKTSMKLTPDVEIKCNNNKRSKKLAKLFFCILCQKSEQKNPAKKINQNVMNERKQKNVTKNQKLILYKIKISKIVAYFTFY